MRAQRDDLPLGGLDDRRATYAIIAVAGAVILGALLYWGMRDPAEPETPASQQVIRDSELVAPAVNTAAAPAPAAASDNATFNQRQLPPPVATVGAGEAPPLVLTNGEEGSDAVVIDGPLLEEIEEDAKTPPPAQ